MNKEIKITATKEELELELNKSLLDLFKQKVAEVHGDGFSFRQDGNNFIAEKNDAVPELTKSKLEILISQSKFSEITSQTAIPSEFKSFFGKVIGTKIRGLISYFNSLEGVLMLGKNDFLKCKDCGKIIHEKFEAALKNYGVDTKSFPVFQN